MSKQVYWRDVAFPDDIVDFRSVGAEGLIVPSGTVEQRPISATNGTIRYDITNSETQLYQNGGWSAIQTTALGGEVNTVATLGAGQPVFSNKFGSELRFKSIVAGTNVTIGTNSNELVINAVASGEVNTGVNIGSGTANIFDSKLNTVFNFRSLRSLSPELTIIENGSTIDFDITDIVSGEANDGLNAGTGAGIYKDKVGDNIRLRSLTSRSDALLLTETSNTITINFVDNPVIPGDGALTIPIGTTAQEPAAADGLIRYDSTLNQLRASIDGAWTTVETSEGTFLPLSGGIMAGSITLNTGADIIGGTNSIMRLRNNIFLINGADLDMSAGGDVLMQAGGTVDGRDVSGDGAIVDAINVAASFGFVTRTSDPNGFERRVLTGTAGQINITNGDGVSGDPVFSIPSNPSFVGDGSMTIPFGTTGEQPVSGSTGMMRINTTTNTLDFFANSVWSSVVSNGADIDVGGNDIIGVNLVDGRDLSVDGVVVDALAALVNDTGVVVRSGDSFETRVIQSNTDNTLLGVSVINGNGSGIISVGLDINDLETTPGLSSADQFVVFDASAGKNVKAATSDIIALLSSSGLASQLDVAGETGFLTRTADGSPGTFARRTITADTADAFGGIQVTDGDGVAGNPKIGLDINGLTATTIVSDNTPVVVYGQNSAINVKATLGVLRENFFNGNIRATSTGLAVNNGVSVVPFTLGSGDFDQNTNFDNGSDSFTPLAGTYRIVAYVETDGSTAAGRYTVRIRRNGSPEGNMAVVVADGTNTDSTQVEDMFIANGSDVFTIEINNATGAATTLAAVRFFAHRVY